MTAPQSPRPKTSRKERAAAAAAARRKARIRWTAVAALGTLVVVGLAVMAISSDDDDTSNVATSGTTTPDASSDAAGDASTGSSGPAAGSVAGEPCVPMAGDPPPGAPAVPVKVGPPPSQLVTEDLKPGTGAVVTAGANVTVNYIGVSCSTGKIFDSSYSGSGPASFPLGQVIEGWQQGIPGMKVGGQRLLGIPPGQAYGTEGRPPDIAPDETLWFVVEVLETQPA